MLLLQKKQLLILILCTMFINTYSAEVKEKSDAIKLDFGNDKIVTLSKEIALKSNLFRPMLRNTDIIPIPEQASKYYIFFKNIIPSLFKNDCRTIDNPEFRELSLEQTIDLINAIDYFSFECLFELPGFLFNISQKLILSDWTIKAAEDLNDEEKVHNLFKKLFEQLEEIKNIEIRKLIACSCIEQLEVFYEKPHGYAVIHLFTIDFLMNKVEKQGRSMLMQAINNGQLAIVKFLLYLNVDTHKIHGGYETTLSFIRDIRKAWPNDPIFKEIERLLIVNE